ncbi:thymidylate synthase, partial [Acinetobacter baumannii]|nr:thymidylate synthase [Acinetobacter baumannii]
MRSYLDLLQHILDNDGDKGDRTVTVTRTVFDN